MLLCCEARLGGPVECFVVEVRILPHVAESLIPTRNALECFCTNSCSAFRGDKLQDLPSILGEGGCDNT